MLFYNEKLDFLKVLIVTPKKYKYNKITRATDTPQAVTPTLPTRADIAPTRRADLGFVGRGNIRFIVDVGIMAPTAKSYVKEYETDLRQSAY